MKKKSAYRMAIAVAACTAFAGSAPLQAAKTDGKIESSFKKTYVYKTYLKDDSIKTEAKDGVVTLTGKVAEESHKSLAEETVAGLPGVVRVDNQLETKAEAAADNADAWIAGKVKMALLFRRHVSGIKTTVEVKDGTVTLKGEASSKAQKELATEYAKDIEGVTAVKNEMTVSAAPEKPVQTKGEKIDDASVTAQVKTALLTHRSTSAIKTSVETRDGKVTLTGIAKNAAEKALVTKLVSDIRGVSSVNNEMTVQ